MIGVVVKGATAKLEKKHTKYRSYKTFDEAEFREDVGRIPFHAAYVFDDVDDIYWAHEWLLTDVINEHAPIKNGLRRLESLLTRMEILGALFLRSACSSINIISAELLLIGSSIANSAIM